jgi:uncharacterized protein (TIGR03086 family)
MDTVATMRRVVDETSRIVNGISEDQLTAQSPCTDWTVRDVINHITGGAHMFAMSAEQGSVPDDVMGQLLGGDNLGDDFKGSFRQAADRAVAAFGEPGVLEKTVRLPFGEMPAGVALNIAIFDLTTHAADLAKATGQKLQDTELAETALAVGKQMIGPDLRQPGFFDAEQAAPADASPEDRLLAFAGRKV